MRKFTEDGLKRYNAEIVLVIIDYKVMWLHALGQQENVLRICVFGEDKTEGLIVAKKRSLQNTRSQSMPRLRLSRRTKTLIGERKMKVFWVLLLVMKKYDLTSPWKNK